MTASDVKASIEQLSQLAGPGICFYIKSIEVVNPLTVEIDTNALTFNAK